MRARRAHAVGFTLVELVVSMVITGIVAGFVAMMVASPVQAYLAQSRRAELSDGAESALRTIHADVRTALPNSVRVGSIGNLRILEVIRVIAPVSYREVWPERTAMRFDMPIDRFSVLETLTLPGGGAVQVVIDNRQAVGRSAYEFANVITPPDSDIDTQTTAAGTDITLSPSFHFTDYSDRSTNQRAYIVSGVIRYECDLASGVLRRYDWLPISSAMTTASAPSSTIARDITSCTFQAVAGSAQNGGMAIVEITTSRVVSGSSTDRLRMVRQIVLENPS